MFYYLLARNSDMLSNLEQISSITIIKYIIFFAFVKLIEFKYLELGFFNYYMILIVISDVLFTVYHYNSLKNKKDVVWTDDVINDNFSLSAFKNDVDDIRKTFLKRKHTNTYIYNNTTTKDADIHNEKNQESENLNTVDINAVVNDILGDDIMDDNASQLFDETEDNNDIKIPNNILDMKTSDFYLKSQDITEQEETNHDVSNCEDSNNVN